MAKASETCAHPHGTNQGPPLTLTSGHLSTWRPSTSFQTQCHGWSHLYFLAGYWQQGLPQPIPTAKTEFFRLHNSQLTRLILSHFRGIRSTKSGYQKTQGLEGVHSASRMLPWYLVLQIGCALSWEQDWKDQGSSIKLLKRALITSPKALYLLALSY